MDSNEYRGFEVRQVDSKKGKGLYATTKFPEGSCILFDKPIVSAQFSWNKLYGYLACEYCMRSMESAEEMSRRLSGNNFLVLPHVECCQVDSGNFTFCPDCQATYCSAVCQKSAIESYHRILCTRLPAGDVDHPLTKLQDVWRNYHLPPESAGIMLVAKMCAMVQQSKEPGTVLAKFDQFVQKIYNKQDEIVHKILGKQFQHQLDVLRLLTSEALCHRDIEKGVEVNRVTADCTISWS